MSAQIFPADGFLYHVNKLISIWNKFLNPALSGPANRQRTGFRSRIAYALDRGLSAVRRQKHSGAAISLNAKSRLKTSGFNSRKKYSRNSLKSAVLFLFRRNVHYLLAVIITAFGANPVGRFKFVTLGALRKIGGFQLPLRKSRIRSLFRRFTFLYCHCSLPSLFIFHTDTLPR